MSPSELILRVAIWPAVAFGLAATRGWRPATSWRVGALFYAVHVAAAFHHAYRWSHSAAVADNVRQVRETLGIEFGAGIWVNYAFSLGWMLAALTWPKLGPVARRVWIAVFLFIAFQGTVVFAHGHGRWIGLALFLAAAVHAWRFRGEWVEGLKGEGLKG